jgi:DNA-binding HxlR family transcriptional regulator
MREPAAASRREGADASLPFSDPTPEETRSLEAAAAVLGKRWKLPILWALGAGPRRYNALAAVPWPA